MNKEKGSIDETIFINVKLKSETLKSALGKDKEAIIILNSITRDLDKLELEYQKKGFISFCKKEILIFNLYRKINKLGQKIK